MILETAVRSSLADQLDTLVNTGTGTAQMVFETSGDASLCPIDLENPAFGSASSGVITLSLGSGKTGTVSTGGTVAQLSFYDRDGTKVWEMSVAVSGSDVDITSTSVSTDDVIEVTSLTITVPAGT